MLFRSTLAAARALYKPRNIDEFDDGGSDFFAVVEGGELVKPLVGHGDHAHVGLDGAEGIVRRFRACVCDRIEQSGFSYVGKSHDSEFHVCCLQRFFLIIIAYFVKMFKPFVCLFFENVLNLSAEKTEYIVMDYKHYIAERLKIDGVSVKEKIGRAHV